MERTIRAAAIAVLLTGVAMAAPRAFADTQQAERSGWRTKQCRFQGLTDQRWSPREERLTAECVTDRWSVPGGLAEFNQIISCESGWNRFAYNAGGPYVGLAQHALSAWASRVHSYTPAHWKLRPQWSNSRTMLIVTARMMHAVGLSPWSCA